MISVHTYKTEKVSREAANALNARFKECSDKPFLFLISGGSSLALLDFIDTSYFGRNGTIAVSDERYSQDPSINNLAQVEKTSFYKKIKANGCQVIDSKPKDNESMPALGQRFENQLKTWLENNPLGCIIASAGIGPDAHTTGIMPYPENEIFFNEIFNNKQHIATAYDAKNKNEYPLRITITYPLIRKIDFVVIYAIGNSKKDALAKLFADKGSLNKSPCRIWLELENVELFTDQEGLKSGLK